MIELTQHDLEQLFRTNMVFIVSFSLLLPVLALTLHHLEMLFRLIIVFIIESLLSVVLLTCISILLYIVGLAVEPYLRRIARFPCRWFCLPLLLP